MKAGLGIIGRKLGMTQLFLDDGSVIPVTVVEAGPCKVIQKKTKERDGYSALQLGFLPKGGRKVKKPLAGHFKKANADPCSFIKEFRVDRIEEYEVGQEVTLSLFQPGQLVDVVGISKGKGFQGVVKRHGFHGFPASRGTHEYFRHGGAVGAHSYPAHVFKDMRMPGHTGNQRVTVQNIEVMDVKENQNLILLRGGIPGSPKGYVLIRSAVKRRLPPKLRESESNGHTGGL